MAIDSPNLIATTDPVFVKRLAKEINRRCFLDGFTTSFNNGSVERKFDGKVTNRRGRLFAKLSGAGEVEITGVESVKTQRFGTITVSRRPELKSAADLE